jgi:hypothetical protein
MNLEKDSSPTGLYNYLPKTSWQKRTGRKGIGSLKQGLLKKVGYRVTDRTTRRRTAVKRAVKKYGKTSTIRKLNAVAVYTRRRSPTKSRTFKKDMKFAQTMKGGLGTKDELQTLLDDLDAEQGRISNAGYKEDPALVRAYAALVDRANKLGVDTAGFNRGQPTGRGISLGNLRNAIEAAHNKAMNLPQ